MLISLNSLICGCGRHRIERIRSVLFLPHIKYILRCTLLIKKYIYPIKYKGKVFHYLTAQPILSSEIFWAIHVYLPLIYQIYALVPLFFIFRGIPSSVDLFIVRSRRFLGPNTNQVVSYDFVIIKMKFKR